MFSDESATRLLPPERAEAIGGKQPPLSVKPFSPHSIICWSLKAAHTLQSVRKPFAAHIIARVYPAAVLADSLAWADLPWPLEGRGNSDRHIGSHPHPTRSIRRQLILSESRLSSAIGGCDEEGGKFERGVGGGAEILGLAAALSSRRRRQQSEAPFFLQRFTVHTCSARLGWPPGREVKVCSSRFVAMPCRAAWAARAPDLKTRREALRERDFPGGVLGRNDDAPVFLPPLMPAAGAPDRRGPCAGRRIA